MKVVHTSGKRKTAIARGTVREGTGKVRINKVPLELYSPELARLKLTEPHLLDNCQLSCVIPASSRA